MAKTFAAQFSISEEEALAEGSQARSASLRLPSPYPIHPDAKPTGWPKGKVAYGGGFSSFQSRLRQ